MKETACNKLLIKHSLAQYLLRAYYVVARTLEDEIVKVNDLGEVIL